MYIYIYLSEYAYVSLMQNLHFLLEPLCNTCQSNSEGLDSAKRILKV